MLKQIPTRLSQLANWDSTAIGAFLPRTIVCQRMTRSKGGEGMLDGAFRRFRGARNEPENSASGVMIERRMRSASKAEK